MYYILVNDDNSLITTQKRNIIQREKLFNKLCFLVPQYYKGYDMSQTTVTMRYLLPISKEFVTETLVLSDEKYEECLKYILPVDTNLSKEFGDIELNLTFTLLDTDENSNIIQRVRKTTNCFVKITPIPDWDSVVPDSALSALDQRILKQDAQNKAIETQIDALRNINTNKADNIKFDKDESTLQLLSENKEIGDKITINGQCDENGVPVVDFNSYVGGGSTPSEEFNNVVEF